MNSLNVAKLVAQDFQSFEAHEMPLFHRERDVEIVLWTLRCLANPNNEWSVPALAAIVEAASRTPDGGGGAAPGTQDPPVTPADQTQADDWRAALTDVLPDDLADKAYTPKGLTDYLRYALDDRDRLS